MFKPRSTLASLAVVTLLAALIVPACKKEEQPAAPAEPQTATPAATAVGDEAVVAVLAKADAYDGTEDKVISKCAACSLNMDGSAENSWQTHGYTMHFCSVDCKESFEKEGDKAIMALAVPGE